MVNKKDLIKEFFTDALLKERRWKSHLRPRENFIIFFTPVLDNDIPCDWGNSQYWGFYIISHDWETQKSYQQHP